MARMLRLEYEGACYHVLNRSNYRSGIFTEIGARQAFLRCLDAAAIKAGWLVHAWCVMSNHYHVALETPKGNLVEGMRWLQATFAMRFNRFRRENGHLFQGRYKALIVEAGESLGPLCHYIHLNPVRAGIVPVEGLRKYPWCSVHWLAHPRERKRWYMPRESLQHAGGLADRAAGHRRYLQYLEWLVENEPECKRQRFDQMSKGWVLGARSFKQALVEEHEKLAAALKRGDRELEVLREEEREAALSALLKCLKRNAHDIAQGPKGARWKVAIAAEMKRRTTASNPWLSARLNMGSPYRVSRLASACAAPDRPTASLLRKCAKCKI